MDVTGPYMIFKINSDKILRLYNFEMKMHAHPFKKKEKCFLNVESKPEDSKSRPCFPGMLTFHSQS